MCGISGILSFGERPDRSVVEAMNAAQVHRGPDSAGIFASGPIVLGIRRLAVVDLVTGDQPITSADGTITVVGNGELYGFAALREELRRRGHAFRTGSDMEVALHLYEDHGTEFARHLRGMFAIALWDERRRRLVLVRDRFGEKPLYIHRRLRGLAFASEVGALLADHATPREQDPGVLVEYLARGVVPGPLSAFAGLERLPPAHMLVAEERRPVEVRRYWQLSYEPKLDVDRDGAAAMLLQHLREAVRTRLVADVPVGALLSGGLDSSAVVALMAEEHSRVRTFSVGFGHASFNETSYAAQVASALGTDHETFEMRADAAALLPRLARHVGEPFADSSLLPLYCIAEETRRHVTVALTGDGGDEALAGYDRYRAMRLVSLVPRPAGRVVASALRLLPPGAHLRTALGRAHRFADTAAERPRRRYARLTCLFPPELVEAVRGPLLAGAPPPAWCEVDGDLDGLLRADVERYLPDDLLVKADAATMAASLESRSPFLDHDVMGFCARLPAKLKANKAPLRRAMAGRLPGEVLTRAKMGFGVPVSDWFRRDLCPQAAEAVHSLAGRGVIDPSQGQRMLDNHLSGAADHGAQLYGLWALEEWHRAFLDG